MRVLCISGKAGSGKDTSANMLKEALEKEGYRVIIAHNADLLKYICRTFFDWNGVKDIKGRAMLQMVGTDIIRKQDKDFFPGFLSRFLHNFRYNWDWALIPDTRFPNELSCFEEAGFPVTHMRIEREPDDRYMTSEARAHASETALDGYIPDVYIDNNGSKEDLEANLNLWLFEELYGHQISIEETKED